MKLLSKKGILFIFLIVAVIGGVIGFKMVNKSPLDISSSAPKITIQATQLIDEFLLDETTANANYLGKLIAVNGTISSIKAEDGKGIISLKTADDFGSILCHLSKEATQILTQIKIGQNIQIKGICTGFLMDVILVRCEIINQ
jgi:DNA/RNA endonuclease YhcR with UshA esterase domain